MKIGTIPMDVMTLYKFMSPSLRVKFGYEILQSDSIEKITDLTRKLYVLLFGDLILNGYIGSYVGLITGKTQNNHAVNVIMANDIIYINADRLESINMVVESLMTSGNILSRIKNVKKNRDRDYMRQYRAYRRLNHIDIKYPIIYN